MDKASFTAACDAIWPHKEKLTPEAPRKAKRHSKADDRIRVTYPPDGVLPDDRTHKEISREIEAKTGKGGSEKTLQRAARISRVGNRSTTPVNKAKPANKPR